MERALYLVLENGKTFKGTSFGASGEVLSEIVFATGMTGYLETLTDKSYYGQSVVQTFPLIGNYGIIPQDFEAKKAWPSAYIVKTPCAHPSNFRMEEGYDLDRFLKQQNIVGLYGIDTRALTKIIRESGVMNGLITADPAGADLDRIRAYKIEESVENVSTKEPYLERASESADGCKRTVALWDFGLKENIKRNLLIRGCDVWVMPSSATAEDILAKKPDGVMLSNGPGDPVDNPGVIRELRKLAGSQVPIFGICLGHQLLALAHGARTEKLKYGHRGANQPVREEATGRLYITSQNHGYAVVPATIDPAVAQMSFVNINDNTCEGVLYKGAPIFSVQFHPEASAGPEDTAFLFDRFMGMMEGCGHAAG